MRSLTVRYNLLSEELASDAAEQADTAGKSSLPPLLPPLTPLSVHHRREEAGPKVLQLPRRVLLSFTTPSLPFLLSDYCFSDETEQVGRQQHLMANSSSFSSSLGIRR